MSSHPYDDAFKTLMYECPELLVAVVNKLFGEHWPRDSHVEIMPNEYQKRDDGDVAARYPDTVFSIDGHLYHIECQTEADGSIVLRIIEYDFLIAMRTVRTEGGVVRAKFPRSAILGLRHGAVRREPYRVEIELPDGATHSCAIPTLSMQEITIDEIFGDELYFLIPFVLFRHERELAQIAEDHSRLEALDEELDEVRTMVEGRTKSGRIDPKSAYVVTWLLDYVSGNLAKRHPVITERVREMRGEVLEIPGLKEWKEFEAKEREAEARGEQRGELRGELRGIQRGIQQGMLNTLFGLVRKGRLTSDEASEEAGMPLSLFNAKMAEYDARPL